MGVSVDVAMIERIVRNVVEQFVFAAPKTAMPKLRDGGKAGEIVEKKGQKSLPKRILTVRDVEHLGETVRELVVLPETLVTPAALDALDERKVVLRRESGSETAETDVWVYAHLTRFSPQTLWPVWQRAGLRPRLGEVVADWKELRSVLKPESWNVILTEEPEEGLCLLNRDGAIRAVSVRNISRLGKVLRNVQPNVLILNPVEIGVYQTGQIVIQATRSN
ncbi:MAG: hypothetical protein Q4E67_01435 [Planctomycetia bacterium]|nr:hypothetical protein [Planctomycetia bacterium]